MTPKLDVESPSEDLPETSCLGNRPVEVADRRSPRNGSEPASGKGNHIRICRQAHQIIEAVDGSILLATELSRGHHAAQGGITNRRTGQKDKVVGGRGMNG